MIDFTNPFGSDQAVFDLFFKAFAVIGSVVYLAYAIVLKRQTSVMLRSLDEAFTPLIRFVSFLQILLAVFMVILALTVL